MSSIDAFLTPGFNSGASHTSLVNGDSSFNKRINSQALVYKDQPMSQAQLERLAVNFTPPDILARLMEVFSDPKNPIYYDGFVFRGVNGLSIAQAFDRICKIATDVILTKAPRMYQKAAQFIAREFVKLFPDFAMKDLPNNINYGSKEWAKLHIGFSYGKKEGAERSGEPRSEPSGKGGQSVDGLSTAQLLTLGDAALKADANWGEKLLLLMAAAMGQLNLGALDTIAPLELKKILARIATEAFADDLAKAALLSKLIEDQKILSSLQKNIPTLPSPYTETDYEAYNHAFSTYRDRSAGMVKMIFEDQTALLPVWAQTEIRGGRARTVPLQMGVSYKQNDVTRVSQKYRYEQPGIFPFFLQIMHEGKERFVLYTLDAVAPELVPEGMGLQEFMTKLDMDAFFPKEWVAQKLQATMVNETRSNAFNHREMPEGKNIDILSFFEPSAWRAKGFQDIGLDLQNRFRSLIQETHKKTYYQDRNDQFATFLQPVAALIPGVGEFSAFAQGDVKGALVNLLGDLLLIFGVGAVSKALESGALASLVGKSADFVEKLVSDTVEKIRPSKPNPASPELIPLIDMGTEETSLEILWGGEGGEIAGTFADTNNQTSTAIFRLKPGQKASDPDALYGILDDNTKKISPQNYLKNPGSNHFVQAGLKGGSPTRTTPLIFSQQERNDYQVQQLPRGAQRFSIPGFATGIDFYWVRNKNGTLTYFYRTPIGQVFEFVQDGSSLRFIPQSSRDLSPIMVVVGGDRGLARVIPDDRIAGVPQGNPSMRPDSLDRNPFEPVTITVGNPRLNLSQLPGIENYKADVQLSLIGRDKVYKLLSNGELLEKTGIPGHSQPNQENCLWCVLAAI